MTKPFDPEAWWPDLFDGLDSEQRRSIVQSWAINWHSGWEPNRDDVADSIDHIRGLIDIEEFLRRADARARARAGGQA